MRLVLDASALVLLAQDASVDPRADLARSTIPEASEVAEIVAPSLLAWELGNIVFVRRAAEWKDDAERGDALAALVEDVPLVTPDDAALRATGGLARKLGLSFYDASYVELAARDADSWLVTEDERLLKAARKELGASRAHDLASLARALERAATSGSEPERPK